MKKLIPSLILGAVLTACASEPPRPAPVQLDYSSLGKIYIDVQDIKVVNRAIATPQKAPYVGHMFQPRLADAVTRWANDRIQAAGNTGHGTLVIKEATVTEQPLPVQTGVESWFTRYQGSKYVGRIEVDLNAQSPVNSATGFATAHATHAVTLPENPNEAEKYAAYKQLLEALMADLNQNLQQAVQDHMARFLLTGPGQGGSRNAVPPGLSSDDAN